MKKLTSLLKVGTSIRAKLIVISFIILTVPLIV